jgi:tetratricopeptide (TPR) repeat protein
MKRLLTCAALAALLPLSAAAVETYQSGSSNDPQVRLSRYLDNDKRHFSALIELRQIAGSTDPLKMPADYQWRLADNYLGFGMRDRAEAIYRSIAATGGNPKDVARAQLRLCEFDFQRGYNAEARATLYRIREKLAPELIADWQDLLARVLMAEGRYGEAADVLLKEDNASKQSPFSRYNLGIALLNDGRTAQGQTVLDRVGTLRPGDAEELALRDRTNLTLGWQFLQTQQGGTAKPVFGRVRVEGPFSNRALLGLGWAELAQQGSRIQKSEAPDDKAPESRTFASFSTLGVLIRPGFLDKDVFDRAGMRSFRLRGGNPESEAALRRALVPWVELISRDPMDPAVQEAWLAIPYTLDQLGAHTQALQYYEKAVDVLEKSRQRMNEAMASIKQGRMVETIVRRDLDSEAGWDWKLRDLPDAPETYFLQSLLAEHRFQEALKNYRDLRMMARNLDTSRSRLDSIERGYLATEKPPSNADELVKRALRDADDAYAGTKAALRMDNRLAVPGTYAGKVAAVTPKVPPLLIGATPVRFNGPYERTLALKTRVNNLRDQLAAAGGDQSRLLQDMATQELEGQRKQIERYLVEARFALARLYDRQQKGELERN